MGICVNGAAFLDVDPHFALQYLRDNLELTGTRVGCDTSTVELVH